MHDVRHADRPPRPRELDLWPLGFEGGSEVTQLRSLVSSRRVDAVATASGSDDEREAGAEASTSPPSPHSEGPPEIVPSTIEGLGALLVRCIHRVEVSARHAERAAEHATAAERLAIDMKKTLSTMATEQVLMRRGVPVTWLGRAALVAFSAGIGAFSAAAVSACVHL